VPHRGRSAPALDASTEPNEEETAMLEQVPESTSSADPPARARPQATEPKPRPRRPFTSAGHGPPRRALLLTPDQVARVIAATAGERFELRDRALLELLYGSAVRASEARRLRVEALDLEGRTAEVLGKGKRWRRVFLPAAAVNALRAHLAAARIERRWVFRNAAGRQVSRQLIARVVAKYCAKAGVSHSSAHTLRHCCASHLLAAGAYLFAVRDVLGHAHAATTSRYLHWIDPGESTEAAFHRLHPRA